MNKTVNFLMLLLLSGCSMKQPESSWHTGLWQLIPEQSQLSFVTTKNKTITEEHTLQFNGGQFKNLQFELTVDLNTIDTQIPIRNQRMKELLFVTDEFPLATITGRVPDDLILGQATALPFELDLHGNQQVLNAQVMVQRVGDQLVVTNYDPIEVNAKSFGLDDGVNQLTQIAKLQSINYGVTVDFKLVFEM